MDRKIDIQRDGQKVMQTESYADRKVKKQTVKETDSQKDSQSEWELYRQTELQSSMFGLVLFLVVATKPASINSCHHIFLFFFCEKKSSLIWVPSGPTCKLTSFSSQRNLFLFPPSPPRLLRTFSSFRERSHAQLVPRMELFGASFFESWDSNWGSVCFLPAAIRWVAAMEQHTLKNVNNGEVSSVNITLDGTMYPG
jgi:hypothetical protein